MCNSLKNAARITLKVGRNHGNHHTVRILRPIPAQGLAAGESLQGEGVLGSYVQEQDSPAGDTAIHRCCGRGALLRMD